MQFPDKTVRLEFRFRHLDGSWRYLEAVGAIWMGPGDTWRLWAKVTWKILKSPVSSSIPEM
jgi:hypothetical protein